MSVTSTGHFVSLLQQSNLLTSQQLDEARAELAIADADQRPLVVERFAERGWLTPWQARMLLAGRHTFFLGRYKLLDHLGEGGMGSVFKAEQTPLGRLVAIKTLRKDLVSSPEMVARFHREIHAAASLSHPNIVAAYDADCVAGRHFLVMEYVEGRDLSALLKGGRTLPVGEACEYVRQAALGLAHAHERGMIHRDIKPSNLLLKVESRGSRERRTATPGRRDGQECPSYSTLDSRPVVKILDMGLARIAHGDGEQTELTHTGQVMGTPDYISPEQARDSKTADARSDIYSLGCTLYRLLAGKAPFQGGSAIEKITARLVDEPPPLRLSVPHAPPELEAVCLKLMAREPDQRYQTAQEVAAALAPFAVATPRPTGCGPGVVTHEIAKPQAHNSPPAVEPGLNEFLQQLASEAAREEEPDTATQELDQTQPPEASGGRQPPVAPEQSHASLAETAAWNPDGPQPAGIEKSAPGATRAGRKLRDEIAARNRADRRRMLLILSAVALFVAVVAGFVVWQKAGETLLIVDWPLEEREGAKIEIDGRAVTLANSADLRFSGRPGTRRVRLSREGYEPFEASFDLARAESKPLRPEWKPTPATARQQEWTALKQRIDAWASGGRQPPVAPDDPSVVELCNALVNFRLQHYGTPQAILAAKQMSRLPWPVDLLKRETIDPYELKMAGQGDVANAPLELVAVLGDSRLKCWAGVTGIVFSPDGSLLASAVNDRTVKLWDVVTGQERRALTGHENSVYCVAFSPDGRSLASGGEDRSIRLWDVAKGQERRALSGHLGSVYSVAFSPDGVSMASASEDGTIKLWKAESGEELRTLSRHAGRVFAVAFSPDGRTIASGGEDKLIKLWDAETGREKRSLSGHASYVISITFSPDGRTLASGSVDRTIKLWNPETAEVRGTFSTHVNDVSSVAFSPDGRSLASGSGDHTVKLWDAESGEERHTMIGHSAWVRSVAFSPDKKTLASASDDGTIKLWDVETGQEKIKTAGHWGAVNSIGVSPDGKVLVTGGADGALKLWNMATGEDVFAVDAHKQAVNALAVSPDGSRLVTGGGDNQPRVWELAGFKVQASTVLTGGDTALAFSPNGNLLAAAVWHEGMINLWEFQGPEPALRSAYTAHNVAGFGYGTATIAFSADGEFLASGGNDHTVRLWNLTGKQPRQTLALGPHFNVSCVAISPDGKLLVSGHTHGRLQVIDLPQRSSPITARYVGQHAGQITSIAFSPHESLLASSGLDGAVRLWRLQAQLGAALETLRLNSQGGTINQTAFTPDGRHLVTANGNGTIYVLRLKEWSAE